MNTLEFNDSLDVKEQKEIVCFNCFKRNNRNSTNSTDSLVATIEKVHFGNNSMYIAFESGKTLELEFNGGYKKYRVNGVLSAERNLNTEIRIERGHIQLNIEGNTLLLERLIAICYDIVNNEMPLSYKGWIANVMDGSGSVLTACKLGISPNYHPDNLEWCTYTANGLHGSMIMEMYRRTGHVYRFSANDSILRTIFLKNDNSELINYCNKNLVMIK